MDPFESIQGYLFIENGSCEKSQANRYLTENACPKGIFSQPAIGDLGRRMLRCLYALGVLDMTGNR
jgi:hypothetical protein